ncbi:unnamed protein product [Prunus brigantina]
MRCGLCAGVPARSTVRRVRWSVWVEDVWSVAPWYRWWIFGRCSGALLAERRSYDIWGEKNKLLRGRLLVFGVGPFACGLDLGLYSRSLGETIEA